MTTWPDRPDLSDLEHFWTAPIAERAAAFAALREREPVPFFAGADVRAAAARAGLLGAHPVRRRRRGQPHPQGLHLGGGRHQHHRPAAGVPGVLRLDDQPGRSAAPRLRRIVSRGFTPKRLAALTEEVQRTASRIVDDALAQGECDAVTAISARLPLKIVCDMMGVPESQYEFVYAKTNTILGVSDPEYVQDTENVVMAVLQAGNELAELMRELGRAREQQPTDDVTSALVNAQIDGERLTPDELASFFILLVVAGNETTRNAISWGLHLLTEHPEQRRIWLADLDGVTPTAVEEIVRWASPVIFMRRTLAVDAVLGGQAMRAGDKVAMFYWAANRDPAHFADPDTFDVRRTPNHHVGFGGPGPHFCLGAHLARREMTVMFRELLTRAPEVHATAAPRRLQSMFINGIKELPVALC